MTDDKYSLSRQWLEANRAKLEQDYPNEWVAVSADGVEAHAPKFDEVADILDQKPETANKNIIHVFVQSGPWA